MKDYSWKIKVSDLLYNVGDKDNIQFEKKFLKTDDVKISEKGISCDIFLQGVNHDEVLVKINKISFESVYNCDICINNFTEKYTLNDLEEVRFINPELFENNETIHDNIFPIDMKNQNIDISELIEIIVKNEEPFVKECGKCKNRKVLDNSENQEEFSSYTIDFGKMLKK